LSIRVAFTHFSVHLEAKHNAHLPVLLYCTGEEPILVNQIHWHESYPPHTIPYCAYAQHISLHYSITLLCISLALSFFFPFISRSLKSCCSALSTVWNEKQ